MNTKFFGNAFVDPLHHGYVIVVLGLCSISVTFCPLCHFDTIIYLKKVNLIDTKKFAPLLLEPLLGQPQFSQSHHCPFILAIGTEPETATFGLYITQTKYTYI